MVRVKFTSKEEKGRKSVNVNREEWKEKIKRVEDTKRNMVDENEGSSCTTHLN